MKRPGLLAIAVCASCLASFSHAIEVTGLTLINANTNRDIGPIKNAATVDLARTGPINVRADVSGRVRSVRYEVDGRTVQTESTAPFALAGDTNGNYNQWNINPGCHTITATPFSEKNARGKKGKPLSMTINVVGRAAGGKQPSGNRPSRPVVHKSIPPATTFKPGMVKYHGENRKWHKVTLAFGGPASSETATPNPFTDYRLDVAFVNGKDKYIVPGYYAADGNAAGTGAASGNVWLVHFCPDKTGTWRWLASFRKGKDVAMAEKRLAGDAAAPIDGLSGSFEIAPTDKTGRDHRGKGRLQYVGGHYLRFAETGKYFLKQGADAPENFLAYVDFDGDFKSDGRKDNLVKTWAPHIRDWRQGDPTWAGGKGKGIIGAVNYIASEGLNAISFIPMNVGGDDRNVFPYLTYDERRRMDCSRLAQWEIVFEHMDHQGIYLHFKTLENENQMLLDGGNLGPERKLYYRELIARFAHHLALNWNLGEEINKASTEQKKAWAQYFYDNDPYRNHIVIHNMGHPHYDLLGPGSKLTGFSLQTNKPDFSQVHSRVKDYIDRSAKAGKPWVVACDEPGDPQHSLIPDADDPAHDNGRINGLWGCLMAGGAGNEWYFGYKHAHSDLTCQDWRSRDLWWDQCRIALQFFNEHVPFWTMKCRDDLTHGGKNYCFAQPGKIYIVYRRDDDKTELNLQGVKGKFSVKWFNPRKGGELREGSTSDIPGGDLRDMGRPPSDAQKDWVILVRKVP